MPERHENDFYTENIMKQENSGNQIKKTSNPVNSINHANTLLPANKIIRLSQNSTGWEQKAPSICKFKLCTLHKIVRVQKQACIEIEMFKQMK